MKRKCAMYLFAVLGCVVLVSAQNNSPNGWIRSKREGKNTNSLYF